MTDEELKQANLKYGDRAQELIDFAIVLIRKAKAEKMNLSASEVLPCIAMVLSRTVYR